MDKNNEAFRRAVGKKQVEPFARALSVCAIQFGAPGCEALRLETARARRPQAWKDFGVADMPGVVVSVVPIGDHGRSRSGAIVPDFAAGRTGPF